ncbi:MAG: disulfide bond formation protein B [Actinomycetota bacterium]|nr:disulfide bond formation protein B [Actinomycetota bacterium]
MATDTATLFFSMLALIALAGAAVTLLALVASKLGLGAADAVLAEVRPYALALAALVAVTSMLGSLYMSEVAGFEPCHYCWLQRYVMYPLAVVLTVAAVFRATWIKFIGIPAALGGLAISIRHYWIQVYPDSGGSCDPDVPCNLRYVDEFGFVSIPFMAGCGFVAIAALLLVARRGEQPVPTTDAVLEGTPA